MPLRGMIICDFCKHLRPERKCLAFPQGIPDEIYLLGFDHRKEFPGDNGVRFEIRHDCRYCENYIGNNKCLAFKKGIPEIILNGEFDHINEFPGDKGYRFKPSRLLLQVIFKKSNRLYEFFNSITQEEKEEFLKELKEILFI